MKALNDFMVAFFGLSIGSIFLLGVKRTFTLAFNIINQKQQKERAELDQMQGKLSSLEIAMKAISHDKIYKLTEEYIDRGWVTLDELDNLEYLYTAYRGLGGNGNGEKRYNRVQNLPVRSAPDGFVQSRSEIDNYDYLKGGEINELER